MKAGRKRRDFRRGMVLLLSLVLLCRWVGPAEAFLSIEDERQMGQKFVQSIRRQFEFVEDDFAEDYLNDLGQYLLLSVESRPFPFQFYLLRDNSLNAFAGPGGHIFMFSGLVAVMDSVDELAAVICHEISHVSARHLAERIEQAKMIGIATLAGMLASILVGGKGGTAVASGAAAAGIQKQLSYSREDERQADQLGFRYMTETGFDPGGMVQVLSKLEKGHWYGADTIPPYLLTHPGGPERMSNIEAMLSSGPEKGPAQQAGAGKYRDLFPFFKAGARAKGGDPHETEAYFLKEIEKAPDSAPAHYGLGILWQERSEYDKANTHFREALKSRPDCEPVLRKLAESHQLKGQDREAIQVLEKILRNNRQDRSSLLLLAKSYQNMENYSGAIRLYERLLLMKPLNDEIYHNLGVCYGRENRLALAHYHFGIYFKRMGETKKARFHFQKAEEFSKGDSVLMGRIQNEKVELRP